MRRDVTFLSQGAELAGWLFEPESAPPWPAVVMAHGFSATRHMAADAYAAAFREAGLAVLLYDHRGFGDSGGEPRRRIDPWVQARGYRDAISFVTQLGEIDADRVGIWGDSMSGAVAIAVASVDDRVAALAVQVPAVGRTRAPRDPDGALFAALAATLRSGDLEPAEGDVEGPMPVVSDDPIRRPAALEPLTAYRWFIEYGGRFGSGWINDVTRAKPRTTVAWHAGVCASHVTCPTLFVVSEQDEMPGAAPAVARQAFDDIAGPKEWLPIDGGHFGLLYVPSAAFERASSAQSRFFRARLSRAS